jgi:hypothetical protein
MKGSQGIHQILEELMSDHAMRKDMTINTRQAHRKATSQFPEESNTSSTQKSYKPNPTRVKHTKASG